MVPNTEKKVHSYLNNLQLELDPQFFIDRMILEYGSWEQHVILYLHRFIQRGWTCVDVGANAGYITLPMAERAGPNGKVIAFEPNPRTREKLLRNLELNPKNLATVELLSCGLGACEATFELAEDLGPGYGNAALRATSNSKTREVKVITLDSLEMNRVDFLKIDVEGMEHAVLEGSTETIKRCRPIVLFETLTNLAPELHKKSEDFLRARDYICYVLDIANERMSEITYPNYPQEDTIAVPMERLEQL